MKTSTSSATWAAHLLLTGCTLVACSKPPDTDPNLLAAVDAVADAVAAEAGEFQRIVEIDHSRLAAAEGVAMPPARVQIFSDARINSEILVDNPRAGIDLPLKVLAYAEDGQPALAYTEAEFIARRHDLGGSDALARFQAELDRIAGQFPADHLVLPDVTGVTEGYGLETLHSSFGFEETIDRLRTAILAEGDTVWFGEVDYHADANRLGVKLPRLTLLLFGGPGPGGKAMADFPRLGLDAFCQKVLVREMPTGKVEAYFNNIVDFARLHYGETAPSHRIINKRLASTLGGAVE